MTVTRQSTGYHYTAGAVLERSQNIDRINFCGAGYLDDFDLGRILHPHGPGQVRSSVGAIVTAESDDLRGVVG